MSQTIWTMRTVSAHLEEAASIHRRLPTVRVPGYHTLWPEALRDDWERLYDLSNGRSRLGPPMPSEVTYHESVMEWLRWLDPETQKVVWMRANRIPWKVLQEAFGKGKTSLWHQRNGGLQRIAAILGNREAAGRSNGPRTTFER